MTYTDENTPPQKTKKSYHDQIMMVADQLRISVDKNDDHTPMEVLRQQLKTLGHLHGLMAKEAQLKINQNKEVYQDISMALRAQNQYCRTALALQSLEERQEKKANLSNELQN